MYHHLAQSVFAVWDLLEVGEMQKAMSVRTTVVPNGRAMANKSGPTTSLYHYNNSQITC